MKKDGSDAVVREEKLDLYKGFLIWSVVLGHCINVFCPNSNTLHLLLRTFDLPMFMFLSGFFMGGSIARHDWKQLLMNKMTGLIVPAVVWALISLLLRDSCFYYFLWAVFVSSAVVVLCERFFSKSVVLCILLTITVVFHLLPYNIFNISFLFPFFLMGYYSKNITPVGWKTGMPSLMLFTILFIFLWKPDYTIWNSGGYILRDIVYMMKVVAIRFALGVAGIYGVSFVLGWLYETYKKTSLVKLFVGIGKETLPIYLLQHVLVEILLLRWTKTLENVGWMNMNQMFVGYLLTPLLSLVLLVLMYHLVHLMKSTKYMKWMFGVRVCLNCR